MKPYTRYRRIKEYNPKTSTSFKLGDITPQTISELIEEGQRDAKYASIP